MSNVRSDGLKKVIMAWRLENGFREARPKTIRKIATVLRVEPKALLKGKEE
jgi:hypothetical protein